MCVCAVVGLTGAVMGLSATPGSERLFPWPAAGYPFIGIDALSAFFLFPIFLMGALGSVYGLGYWPQRQNMRNARKLQVFWGLIVAGMVLLVVSRHAMAFLLGWEVMAISAFFLISTEDDKEEPRRAGWIYLIATHVSTLTLFGLFTLWHWATGSYLFVPLQAGALGVCVINVLFFIALLGFGMKAGVMPLQFWLPGAHANAPSHVSAIMSGVVIKMGIYGLVRFLWLVPNPPHFWGGLILLLGAVSGLLGVAFAIGQHDIKRLLAYHSVENIGIIMMGLGVAMLGRSSGRPAWVVLGLAGCLLHVWNHSLFKSLLFFSAGSVVHASHTRDIDSLGGLAKKMPWTALMFLIGAVAICGLPPLNGFVSELFVYLGLLRTFVNDGAAGAAAVMAVPVLAMIGALAVACFVKVFGAVFLGSPRTQAAQRVHESPRTMRLPMTLLAIACAVIGLAPLLVAPALNNAIFIWKFDESQQSVSAVAPLATLSVLGIVLLIFMAALMLMFAVRRRTVRRSVTWDCGYAKPTARIQYTASSFAQMIVSLFSWVLRPRVHRPRVGGLFPKPAGMHSHIDDIVLDGALIPSGRKIAKAFNWFRRFQHGMAQSYVLYILIAVILMLCTLIPFEKIITRIFSR